MSIIILSPIRQSICNSIIAHEPWRAARGALLSAASARLGTTALIGPAGTGKSWLLRHLEHELRQRQQRVTLLRQGDLPWQLEPGAVLLVDEASRLPPAALAELAAQTAGVVILADLPKLAAALSEQSLKLPTVQLSPLHPEQIGGFVAEWLRESGRSADAVTDEGIERLAFHSGGTPRLLVLLLNAAFNVAGSAGRIAAAEIDEVAQLRVSGLDTDVTVPVPVPVRVVPARAPEDEAAPSVATPRRRGSRRRLALAIGAAALLVLRQAAVPADQAPPVAATPAPALAASASPASAASSLPEVAASAIPELVRPASPPQAPASRVDLANAAAPDLAPTKTASGVALVSRPGLILVARRGDTLRALYGTLYRGVEPPPFDAILAANPQPVRPGGIVVFPSPPGGWQQH